MTRGQLIAFALSVAVFLLIVHAAISAQPKATFPSWSEPTGDRVEIREETP